MFELPWCGWNHYTFSIITEIEPNNRKLCTQVMDKWADYIQIHTHSLLSWTVWESLVCVCPSPSAGWLQWRSSGRLCGHPPSFQCASEPTSSTHDTYCPLKTFLDTHHLKCKCICVCVTSEWPHIMLNWVWGIICFGRIFLMAPFII